MVNLLQNNHSIIAEHSLNTSFDHLWKPLQKIEQSYKSDSLSYNGAVNSPDLVSQKAILRLLYTLQGHEVALDLCLKIENSNIATELSKLFELVQSGCYNYEHYCALSQLVIKQAPDVDIWNAVFDLISTVFWVTSSTSISIFYDRTLIIHFLTSQQGAEQTHQLLNERIFEEILRCTYQNVEGFFWKYFERKKWSKQSKNIYNVMKSQHVNRQWINFSDPLVQNAVWKWLHSFQNKFLFDTQGIYYMTKSIKNLTDAEVWCQLNLFIKWRSDVAELTHD